MSSLVERDQKVVWHPYAPPAASPLFAVERASGVRLVLEDGRELVDGMSSWWSTIHGYRHPHIEAARTMFRLHQEAALEYLSDVVVRDPGHANGRYALGLALLELDRTKEALDHLELAREMARPGPRVAALEEIIRAARDRRQG